jgi:hypothetical protein
MIRNALKCPERCICLESRESITRIRKFDANGYGIFFEKEVRRDPKHSALVQ